MSRAFVCTCKEKDTACPGYKVPKQNELRLVLSEKVAVISELKTRDKYLVLSRKGEENDCMLSKA